MHPPQNKNIDLKSRLSTGLLRGEGGVAGPLSSKILLKSNYFFDPFPYVMQLYLFGLICFVMLLCLCCFMCCVTLLRLRCLICCVIQICLCCFVCYVMQVDLFKIRGLISCTNLLLRIQRCISSIQTFG